MSHPVFGHLAFMQKPRDINPCVEQVCNDCATDRGARIPEEHSPTWWIGKCDLCGCNKEVTATRDYGRTRHLLK